MVSRIDWRRRGRGSTMAVLLQFVYVPEEEDDSLVRRPDGPLAGAAQEVKGRIRRRKKKQGDMGWPNSVVREETDRLDWVQILFFSEFLDFFSI